MPGLEAVLLALVFVLVFVNAALAAVILKITGRKRHTEKPQDAENGQRDTETRNVRQPCFIF